MYLLSYVVAMKDQMSNLMGDSESLAVWVVQCIYANDGLAILHISHAGQFFVEWRVLHYCA